jgi:maltose alpha-D-glucosyltransferase/alpha-amylase
MQWSPDRNAGFSRADPQRLYLPPIMDAVYGYQSVNVEAQLRSSSSLLHWTRRLIATRASYRAFGRGTLTFLEPGNRKVIAYLREYENEAMLCVANLSRVPQAVELDLARFEQRVPVEIMGKASFAPIGKLPYLLTLAGHGYFAFQLSADAKPPAWHEERLPYRPLPVLVLGRKLAQRIEQPERARDARRLILNMTRERLRDEILVPYLRSRRWFSREKPAIKDAFFGQMSEWNTPEGSWLMAYSTWISRRAAGSTISFRCRLNGNRATTIRWKSSARGASQKYARKERMGVLYAAFGNPRFARALARAMGDQRRSAPGTRATAFLVHIDL